MKLLFDQNISYKIIKELQVLFPHSSHVYLLGLHEKDDAFIWKYAKQKGFIIVTQDTDFYERSLVKGFPPKVILIKMGNTSTQNIKESLIKNVHLIQSFDADNVLACIEIV